MPDRDAKRGPAVLLLLSVLALLVLSTGCSVSVEEPQKAADAGQRTALSKATALPRYDVAISAVDFDPPLGRDSVLDPRRPVKLVAAIENKGTMQLSRLMVEARVSSQQGDFSVRDQVSLDKLSPGETRVVEFRGVGPLTTLPRAPSFRINVSVDSPLLDSTYSRPSRELTVRVLDQ